MPLTKFRKDSKEVKSWTIYLWQEGDLVKGAAKVILKDGFNDIFISGRQVERVEGFRAPSKKKDIHMARSQTKSDLENTLNALNWYGKQIIKGNEIDRERFAFAEMKTATDAVGMYTDISKLKPVRKFPVKNITFEKALKLGLA